jgi:hypothetical protein
MINRNRNKNISNYHAQYMAVLQHWSEESEKFAGADALITALSDGWEFGRDVEVERYHFSGNRSIRVYNIPLKRDHDEVVMPVIDNPYLTRMLSTEKLNVREKSGEARMAVI